MTEQIRQLTKALYGSKSEKSKYQVPDGQGSLFEDDLSFNEPEQTEEQSTETVSYTVTRKKTNKKRNDSFREDIEIEEIHHHPNNIACDCCRGEMVEFSSMLVREEAKFIPASLKRVQHFIQNEGPVIVLFKSALSRGRAILEDLIKGSKVRLSVMAIQLMVNYLMFSSLTVGRTYAVIG